MNLSSWAFRTWPWLWSLESTARDQQHKIDICRYSLLEKLTNCTNKSPGPGMLCAGMLKNRDLLFIYLQKKVEWSGTRLFSVRTTSTLQSQQQKYHISTMFQFFREIDKSKKWIQPRPWSLAVRLLVWAHDWVCDGPLLVVSGQSHGDTSGEPSYDAPLWIGHNLYIPTAEVRWQHWVSVDMWICW